MQQLVPPHVQIVSSGSGLNEEQLRSVEERIGTPLPGELRAFFSMYNGGRPKPDYAAPADGYATTVHEFVQAWPLDEIDALWKDLKDPPHPRIPPEYIPFAYTPGGDLLCMCAVSDNSGKVCFWDHEEEGVDEYTYDNLYLVADSLADMLTSLREYLHA